MTNELLKNKTLTVEQAFTKLYNVMIENLPIDAAENFKQSLKETINPVVDFNTKNNVPLKEEDFDD